VGELVLPAATSRFVDGLSAAISRDARFAYCSLGRDRIGVFALPSGKYLRSFVPRFPDPDAGRIEVFPWRFDPAGRLVLVASDPGPYGAPWSHQYPPLPPDDRVGLIDVSTDRLVAQARLGDIGAPTAAAWTPDGSTLALGTGDGTLALYAARSLRLRTNAGIVTPAPVGTLAVAPDGRTLVLGAGDLSFWTVPDLTREGAPVGMRNSHVSGGVWGWYAADGDVVGLADDTSRPEAGMRWFTVRVDPASLTRLACHLAGSDMTRSQWHRYVGDQPYRQVCR
jgi:hypothetical protein